MFVRFGFFLLIASHFSVNGLFDADLLARVTLSFAENYYVTCVISLYNGKMSREEKIEIFNVQKILVKHSFRTCGIYTFEKYISLRSSRGFAHHKNSCFKPMKLIFAKKDGKSEFTDLTLRYPMADSLWLVFLNSSIGNFFHDAKVPFNTQLIAVTVINSNHVDLHEVYRVYYGFPIRVNYFGNWTSSHGLRVIKGHIYTRRSDLEGKLFKTGSTENWPMSFYKNGEWDGYYLRVWKLLQEYVNCTSVNLGSLDNAMGIEVSKGRWSGVVGMLIRGEIDVVASDMNINLERSYVVDFLKPLFFSRHQVFFRQPGNNLEWTSVFEPFPPSVWLTIIAWLAVGSLAISFCYQQSVFEKNRKSESPNSKSFFLMFQSICQQGSEAQDIPKSTSCRIIFFFAYLVPTIIIPSYSAALISSLTHESPNRPFQSLQEMLQDGTYKLIVVNNSAEYLQFFNNTNPMYEEIFRKLLYAMSEDELFDAKKYSQDLILCKQSKYALYYVEEIFKMKMEKHKPSCKVIRINQPFDTIQQSIGLPKNSAFTGLMNYHLQKMYESGIINRLQQSLALPKLELKYGNYNEVDLRDVFQIFIFLLLAVIISTWLLVIEKINAKANGKTDEENGNLSKKLSPRFNNYLE